MAFEPPSEGAINPAGSSSRLTSVTSAKGHSRQFQVLPFLHFVPLVACSQLGLSGYGRVIVTRSRSNVIVDQNIHLLLHYSPMNTIGLLLRKTPMIGRYSPPDYGFFHGSGFVLCSHHAHGWNSDHHHQTFPWMMEEAVRKRNRPR